MSCCGGLASGGGCVVPGDDCEDCGVARRGWDLVLGPLRPYLRFYFDRLLKSLRFIYGTCYIASASFSHLFLSNVVSFQLSLTQNHVK